MFRTEIFYEADELEIYLNNHKIKKENIVSISFGHSEFLSGVGKWHNRILLVYEV